MQRLSSQIQSEESPAWIMKTLGSKPNETGTLEEFETTLFDI
jgi:hypothetical protein